MYISMGVCVCVCVFVCMISQDPPCCGQGWDLIAGLSQLLQESVAGVCCSCCSSHIAGHVDAGEGRTLLRAMLMLVRVVTL